MNREALVVGINSYPLLKNERTGKALNLRKSAQDAEEIAQLLGKYGNFKVVKRLPLTQKDGTWKVDEKPKLENQVTQKILEEAISQLFNPPDSSFPDTALLFFSGHGLQRGREVFLATSDANPSKENRGVSLDWLLKQLQKSPVRQLIIWLDCCHSGGLFKFEEDFLNIFKDRDGCFIAASREFELAIEKDDGGVLTRALCQGLSPKQRNLDLVTSKIIVDFINQKYDLPQGFIARNFGSEIILTGKEEIVNRALMDRIPCPYKGLAYFDFNDEDPKHFYGRKALTDRLLEKVRETNFVAVLGASGSGKSSVVRAGLLHHIKMGAIPGSDKWKIYNPFTPGEHPLKSLQQAIGQEADLVETELVIQLTDFERVVLVIDQFEEVFTLCQNDAERQKLFDCLMNTVERIGNKLCLILAMRADFQGKFAEREYAGLATKIDSNLLRVMRMSEQELTEAIIKPAQEVGLGIDKNLITKIIEDVSNSPGDLPLMQYALTQMWEQRQVNYFRLDEYNQLGGVKGTLKKQADQLYQGLSDEEKLTAKRIFLELTQLGEGTEDTRRRVIKQNLVNQKQSEKLVERVLDKLETARLVVTSQLQEQGEGKRTLTVVDVAHEALIRHWPLLQEWVKEHRDAIRVERKIEAAAEEWESQRESDDYLLFGAKLVEAENYLLNHCDLGLLSVLAQKFVETSQAQQRKKRQARRTIRGLTIGGVMAVLAIFLWSQWRASEIRQVSRLSTYAPTRLSSNQNFDDLDALIKSLQAAKRLKQIFWPEENLQNQVRNSLQKVVYGVRERNRIEEHLSWVFSVTFSPDGKYFATAGYDRTARLWNWKGEQLAVLKGHKDSIYNVSFSPNGKLLATASYDGTARLWDLNGNQLRKFDADKYHVVSVSFSPDGKQLATAGSDGSVKLWNLQGKKLVEFPAHEGLIYSVCFSLDGKLLATAGKDKKVRLWNRAGKQLAEFKEHKGWVYNVSFSPDGKYLASASADETARVWDLKGKQLAEFKEHKSEVRDVRFTPDGKQLASVGNDRTVRLWDLKGKQLAEFKGHQDTVLSLSFSRNGKLLATAGKDGTARLWDLNDKQYLTEFKGHRNGVWSVSFSPDGKQLATAGAYGFAKLWDLNGKQLAEFKGHKDVVWSISFSPDGQYVATGGEDGKVRLWNRSGKQLAVFLAHKGEIQSVSFSPDSKRLASAGNDSTARLWDLKGNKLAEFKGHIKTVLSVSFSPDGKYLATGGSDSTVRLWDLKGNQLRELKGHRDFVNSISFSPDSKLLATTGVDDTLRLWDLNGKQLREFKTYHGSARSVSFSPDGKLLATVGNDSMARLWDLEGQQVAEFKGHQGHVVSVRFSPDGKLLATASTDNTAKLWRVENLDELIARGCDWIGDYLKNNRKVIPDDRHVCDI